MAFRLSYPNNKSFLAITGNFTGTTNEYFEVKVRDVANNEKWLWRYKSETPTVISNVTSDISNNKFTTPSNHNIATGQTVSLSNFIFTSVSNPGTQGLQNNFTYYFIKLTNTTFSVSSTLAGANAGTAIPIFGTSQSNLKVATEWSAWYDKDGDVSEYGDAVVVNTNYALRSGISVMFTRTNANSYTSGDKWCFVAYADYAFENLGNNLEYLQSIDIDDTRNLLAIDGSGNVSVVENIDGENPNILNTQTNIGPISNSRLDFETKNKEIYVAKGKDRPARWLGYNKNGGMAGQTNELQLKSQLAMDVLVSSIETPDRNAFYKSIALRGGGGEATKDARIIVGLKEGADDSKFYIYNRHLDRQFEITLQSRPYIVKKYLGIFDSNKYTDGFMIVRESTDAAYVAEVDLFDLDTSGSGTLVGQSPNRICTMGISNPVDHGSDKSGDSDNSGLNKIHDILLIPDKAPGHSSYSSTLSGGTNWTLVISGARDCYAHWDNSKYQSYEWLWKTEIDAGSEYLQGVVATAGWDNITPKTVATSGIVGDTENFQNMHPQSALDGQQYSRPPGWYWVFVNSDNSSVDVVDEASAYGTWGASQPNNPIDAKVKKFQFVSIDAGALPRTLFGIENVPALHSLEFCGYDNEGQNPIIGYTCEFSSPMYANQGNGVVNYPGIKPYADQVTTSWEFSYHTGYDHADLFGPVYLDGRDGELLQSDAKVVVNDYLKKQVARPLRWVTNFIPISTVEGPQTFKMLSHTVDFEDSRELSVQLKSNLPNVNDNANISELIPYQDSTIGSLNLDACPSNEPLFGLNGRFNIITEGVLRRRAVMSYIKKGNRQYNLFRFGDEASRPMNLQTTIGSHPTVDIFPNDWNKQTTNTPYNAYTNWEKGLSQPNYVTDYKQGSTYFYAISTGTNANAGLAQKSQSLPEIGSTGDDKNGYRLTETNWWAPSTDWKDGVTTVWHPNTDVADYAYAVKNDAFQDIAFFKMVSRTGGTTTSLFSSGNDNYFNITSPVTMTGTDWAGPIGVNTAFYRASLVLDGYQETAFISTTAAGPATADNDPDDTADTASGKDVGTHLKVTVQIKGGFDIPSRVTGVAVYRAISLTDSSTDPQSQYRFIQEIALKSFGWNETTGYFEFDVIDTGDAEATYEAINGISENIYNLHINYSCNAQLNGYMFAGNCEHSEIEDASNYVFRSQPAKYSIFDWSKDFIQLPFVPVALQGFQGKLFAFSNNQMSMVNPESLYIEDTVQGIGCINTQTKMVTDGGLIWADYRNIYMSTPQVSTIGGPILNVDDYGWLNLSVEEKDAVRFGYDAKRKSVLMFFTKTISSTDYHLCWAYSLSKKRWDLWQTDSKVKDTLLTKDGHTILLLDNNKIQKYLSRTNERADWEWHSKKLGMGETMVDKKVRNIKVEGSDRANISLQYKVPENNSAWQTGQDVSSSFSGSTNTAIKLANVDNGKLHWVKLKIAGSNTNRDVRAKATSVIYKPKRPK